MGFLKKSNEYYGKSSSQNSKTSARVLEQEPDTALLNRFPVWNLGEEGTNGFIQIVEIPYVASKVKLQIPDSSGLSDYQINKIRITTLRKVLIIIQIINFILIL